MGEGAGRRCGKGGWHSLDPLLAHSGLQTAEDVHAASQHEFGGDASAHPARVGSFLQPGFRLETVALYAQSTRATRLRLYLETIPSDVRKLRHHYRQRPPESVRRLGPLARDPLP